MVGLQKFAIELDSPTGAYYAGTTVTGRVILQLAKPKTVRAINLKIEGVAKVKWEERESYKDSEGDTKYRDVSFTAEEEYFKNKFKLLGSGSGDTEITIGDHVYPFSSSLPPLLPSSFQGEHGSVKYFVKAVMDRPWKIDHETQKDFTVVAPLDLNYIAKAKEPVKIEDEKTFCCLCCQSGPLQLVVSMPYSGFVAGQSIPLTIEIDNASNVEVDHVICKLKKGISFVAHSPSHKEKSDSIELIKLTLEGVSENGSKSWTQQLSIPEMPFVNLDACSIIKMSYVLKVKAEVSGCHSGLDVDIPIIIGSVSIGQQASPYPGAPQLEMSTNTYNTNSMQGISPGWGVPQQPAEPGFIPIVSPPALPSISPTGPPYPSGPLPPGVNPALPSISPAGPPYPSGPLPPGVNPALPSISPPGPPYPSGPLPPGVNPTQSPPPYPSGALPPGGGSQANYSPHPPASPQTNFPAYQPVGEVTATGYNPPPGPGYQPVATAPPSAPGFEEVSGISEKTPLTHQNPPY